jgi:serine/threonine protein phosphatase PrpC
VSRTIGDIEAKDVRLGGNPNVVICTPDIHCFKLLDSYDCILIGCDGIFEKLNNEDVNKSLISTAIKPGI